MDRTEEINYLNIETIFDFGDFKYTPTEDMFQFYEKFKSMVHGFLKVQGQKKNGVLDDEIISPSLDDLILVWCLEKISPDLPLQVKQTFSSQLKENSLQLKHLLPDIFKVTPMLLDFDIKEGVSDETISFDVDDISHSENGLERGNEDDDFFVDNIKLETKKKTKQGKQKRGRPKTVKKLNSKENTKCSICDKEFKSEKHLGWHQRYHKEENESYSCNICGKILTTKLRFYAHKQTHKIEHCQCEICEKSFETRKSLTDHIYKHHRTNIKCKKCDSILANSKEYYIHVKNHENELIEENKSKTNMVEDEIKVYKITSIITNEINDTNEEVQETTYIEINPKQESQVEFKEIHNDIPEDNRNELENHIATKRLTNIPCKNCDLLFNDIESFRTHQKSVHMILHPTNYSCEICGKVLRSVENLKLHLKNHNRNFTCNLCDIKFDLKQSYSAHMLNIHNVSVSVPEPRTPCELCGKLVTQLRLKKHMKIHLVKFRCTTCSRTFTTDKDLGSHVCKHYSCDICERKFIQGRNLELHKREHNGETMHQCDLCEALFDKKKLLGSHRRFMHFKMKRFECELCPKDFAVKTGLINHLRLHTGERPYKCKECGLTFRTNSSLHTHKKMHSNELPHKCDGCHKRFRMAGNLKSHRESKLCGVSEGDLFRNTVEN